MAININDASNRCVTISIVGYMCQTLTICAVSMATAARYNRVFPRGAAG